MAHGIYTSRDFQIGNKVAWHKLTRVKQPERTDFPFIRVEPLFYGDDCKAATHGDSVFVLPVADDDGLPVAAPFSGSYTLFQPREAWDWVHETLSGTGFSVESIGMLWNRSFWFLGVVLNELQSLSVGDGRQALFNLNFSGALDKSTSPQCELASILPVCWNTISLSRMQGKVLFKTKATKNFATRLELAKAEVENAVGMTAIFRAAMGQLAERECTQERAERVFAGLISDDKTEKLSTRAQNMVAELTDLHETGDGNKGETEFDLLNAFTEFHTRGSRDSDMSAGKRFTTSEFGTSADAKAEFARLLTTGRTALPAIESRGEKLLLAS